MRLNDRFEWGARTYVMGILNVTPDSFSGDGLLREEGGLLERARAFVSAGTDILDIGGESTRPGAESPGEDAERDRVVPAIAAVRAAFPDIAISVDTYRAAVAAAALDAGADIVNDVWGLRADPNLAALAADRKAPVVLTHNRSKPGSAKLDARLGGQYVGAHYDDLLEDVARELSELADNARAAGIARGQIVLDPGLGFGKTVAQNLELMNRLDRFRSLGYPLLVGPSRKSFIGRILDLPVGERDEGTAAAIAICIARGADIVRVHDVATMIRIARMTDAIVRPVRDG